MVLEGGGFGFREILLLLALAFVSDAIAKLVSVPRDEMPDADARPCLDDASRGLATATARHQCDRRRMRYVSLFYVLQHV